MLRDVVVHIENEQPIRADLIFEPAPTDAVLICRNLRTINGTKPTFVDRSDSTFMIPLVHVRFVEIHQASIEVHAAEAGTAGAAEPVADEAGGQIAKLGWPVESSPGATAATSDVETLSGPPDRDLPEELDGELLRRIRDV
jgi:hypothetical protein